jgi:hypothetical protein
MILMGMLVNRLQPVPNVFFLRNLELHEAHMAYIDKMKRARADCHFIDLEARDADEEDKEGGYGSPCVSFGKHSLAGASTAPVEILERVLTTYYRFIMVPS